MIKLIVSDIGGVLIKTDEAIINAIEQVFNKHKIPLGSKENMLKVFGISLYDYILNYLPNKDETLAKKCYNEFKHIYPYKVEHLIKPFPVDQSLFLINDMGINLAIISCMSPNEIKHNLNLLKFKHFSDIISLEEFGHNRPDPKALYHLMDKFKSHPSETIYIGDTTNDIKMAQAATVISVAVKTGVQDNVLLEHEKPDFLIDKFEDLLSSPQIIQR